jgi:hypothetical protein
VIDEILHAPSGFEIPLDAPPSIVHRLASLADPEDPVTLGAATLVVSDVWVDAASLGNADTGTSFHPLLDLARWCGVLTTVAPNGETIAGHGLAWHLGTPDGSGELMVGNAMTSDSEQNARIFVEDSDDWLDVLVNGNVGAPITSPDGSSATLELRPSSLYDAVHHGAATVDVPYFPEPMTRADVLTRIASFTGRSWYIDAQGVVHMGTQAALFPNGPRCIVGRVDPDPEWMTLPADLDTDVDLAGWANKWVAFNDGKNTSYPWDTIYAYPNNVDPINEYYRDLRGNALHIVAPDPANNNETVAEWQARMESRRAERETPRRQFTVSGAVDEHSHRLIPGEPVHVYDPEINVSDPATEFYCGGQTINPATVTLQAISWPVRRGMGVWLVFHDAGTDELDHMDLTPYIVWEDGAETTLEVGTLRWIL